MSGVRDALELYRTFQAKEPDFVTALEKEIQLPERLGASGKVLRLWYESGKWRQDEAVGFYVHCYDEPTEFCEPWRRGLRPVATPGWSRELVQLGRCVLVEVAHDGGEVLYPLLGQETLLCATPEGKALVLLDPDRGFVAAIVGGSQQITDRGIEG